MAKVLGGLRIKGAIADNDDLVENLIYFGALLSNLSTGLVLILILLMRVKKMEFGSRVRKFMHSSLGETDDLYDGNR
jgi:hypothetical protein